MTRRAWTPSIVAGGADDETVYLVKDDLGRLGAVWREADAETTDLETVITDLLTGQYSNSIRVIAFNTVERCWEDISEDIARKIRRRCDLQLTDVPSGLQDFVERHEGHDRAVGASACMSQERISAHVVGYQRPSPAVKNGACRG